MLIFVDRSGLKDLQAVLLAEGVAFQERPCGLGMEVQASLPEVQVPREYTKEAMGTRAFRLPSGRLIITDPQGNVEQITRPARCKT